MWVIPCGFTAAISQANEAFRDWIKCQMLTFFFFFQTNLKSLISEITAVDQPDEAARYSDIYLIRWAYLVIFQSAILIVGGDWCGSTEADVLENMFSWKIPPMGIFAFGLNCSLGKIVSCTSATLLASIAPVALCQLESTVAAQRDIPWDIKNTKKEKKKTWWNGAVPVVSFSFSNGAFRCTGRVSKSKKTWL